jgi:S1-C subfamily serine protease
MVMIGAVAVVSAAIFLVFLLSPASDHPSLTPDTIVAAPVSTVPGLANAVPAVVDSAGQSMVELEATTSHGVVALIGIAVAEGGLVATTADALGGLERLDVVGPGGKLESASVVGQDRASDVALIQVPEDVPVAPFSDDGALAGGAPDYTLALEPNGTNLDLESVPGTVSDIGTALADGPANGMPSITSAVTAAGSGTTAIASEPGEPLVNSSGQVLGILYDPTMPTTTPTTTPAPAGTTSSSPAAVETTSTSPPPLTEAAYLPTQLVVGVADELRSGTDLSHGWLGVAGTDQPTSAGAKIESVQADSPAAGHLEPGEVVVAIGGQPVRTMAELRARLYVLSPGTAVALSVQGVPGTSAEKVVDITLGHSS